jgi:hypothetical protein
MRVGLWFGDQTFEMKGCVTEFAGDLTVALMTLLTELSAIQTSPS